MKNLSIKLVFVTVFSSLFLLSASPAEAFFLTDWFNNAKKAVGLNDSPKPILELKSAIQLAENGDLNNNGQIDSGDLVTFHYVINNQTNNKYKDTILKTNIPRKNINFIHNVSRLTGLDDNSQTISIPNLNIQPYQIYLFSFSARVNYSKEDLVLSTEPELVEKNNVSILRSTKSEVIAKKLLKKNSQSESLRKIN